MSSYYTITAPVSVRLESNSPTLVRLSSPFFIKKHVEILAYYFKREFHYDFPQFEAGEKATDPDYTPYEVWLFHREALDELKNPRDDPRRVIGAACFRLRPRSGESRWALQWVWFHPYERQRGHLSKQWPEFERRYGRFPIEEPVSYAMGQFLKKKRRLDRNKSFLSVRAEHRRK